MDIFRITGGIPLRGRVQVSGSKNSALPLFAASLLTDEETILENVPNLSDVNFMAEILTELGAEVPKLLVLIADKILLSSVLNEANP